VYVRQGQGGNGVGVERELVGKKALELSFGLGSGCHAVITLSVPYMNYYSCSP
jgi:hypothetical protein